MRPRSCRAPWALAAAAVFGAAVKVMKIAMGEIVEVPIKKSGRVLSGRAGGAL